MRRNAPILTVLALSAAASAACATAPQPVAEVEPTLDPAYVARQRAMQTMRDNFERVNFEFDSSLITPDTREALFANVDLMRRFPEITVEVEGHCDEVGSVEYNLALGQRRAQAIAKYMVAAGVARARVRTISYGKERPLAERDATNRRAEFRVALGISAPVEGTVAQTGDWLTIARTR